MQLMHEKDELDNAGEGSGEEPDGGEGVAAGGASPGGGAVARLLRSLGRDADDNGGGGGEGDDEEDNSQDRHVHELAEGVYGRRHLGQVPNPCNET